MIDPCSMFIQIQSDARGMRWWPMLMGDDISGLRDMGWAFPRFIGREDEHGVHVDREIGAHPNQEAVA